MHLLRLPDELLEMCYGATDIKALRLTCKRLALLTTKQVFADVLLKPTTKSAKKLRAILGSQHLASLITALTIHASIDLGPHFNQYITPAWKVEIPYDGPFDGNDQADEQVSPFVYCDEEDATLGYVTLEHYTELSTFFKRTLHDIGLIQNLRHVTLHYRGRVRTLPHPKLCPLFMHAPEPLS